MSRLARSDAGDSRSPALARPGVRLRVRAPEALPLAIVAGALDLVLGLYINLQLHYISGDAFSRVANAYDVIYGRDPHLAAIGFIWNPLPSIMELPILLLHSLWGALSQDAVASLFVSAAFAGIAVYYLADTLRLFGIGTGWRIAMAILFATNPMVLFYSANGMSDMMLVGALMASVSGTVAYVQERSLGDLIAAGSWLAVAFGIRYEGAPLGVFLALGLGLALYGMRRQKSEIRGSMLLLLAPLLYVSGLWIYFNWLIMKRPLYFLTSAYGNLSQTSIGGYVVADQALQAAKHHIIGTVLFVAHMALLFWPVFPGIAVALWLCFGRRRDPIAPVLVGATVGMPLLQAALLYQGHSGGWARYFIYYIPDGFLLLGFAASRLRGSLLRNLALVLAVLCMALGNAVTLYEDSSSAVVGFGDTAAVTGILRNQQFHIYASYDGIVRYLNRHPHFSTLVDSFLGYPIVLRVKNPKQLIITSDVNFKSILENPLGRVDALLVPDPVDVGALDAVNRAWPTLWAGRVPWAHLIVSFRGQSKWRLYAVGPGAP